MAHLQSIAPTSPASEDLSDAIAEAVEKEPGEDVRSVRVYGDCYRCNWWARDKTAHAWFATSGTIRKSRFLRATRVDDQLVMEDLSKD